MNDKNILGQGNYSTAYNIPSCDEYCFKINTLDKDNIVNADFSKAKIQDTEDKNLKINIGQQIAKISIPRDYIPLPFEIEIMKKQAGESIGTPHPDALVRGEYTHVQRDGLAPYEDYSRKEKYARTIHKVASLPVQSYERLILEFLEAKSAGYSFDHLNSNNLLVDSDSERINLVDMERGEAGNLPSLLYALTNIQYNRTFCDEWYNPVSEEQRIQAQQDTIEIIVKFMEALDKLELSYNTFNTSADVVLGLHYNSLFTIAQNIYKEKHK